MSREHPPPSPRPRTPAFLRHNTLGIYGRRVCASDPLIPCCPSSHPSSVIPHPSLGAVPSSISLINQLPVSNARLHSIPAISPAKLFSRPICLSATVHPLSLHHSTLQTVSLTRPRAPSSSLPPTPSFHPSLPAFVSLSHLGPPSSLFSNFIPSVFKPVSLSFAGWSIAHYHTTHTHACTSPSVYHPRHLQAVTAFHYPSPSTVALPLLGSSFRT